MNSMTAYAQLERTYSWGTAKWEIRSVNHRYLELHLKWPDELKSEEDRARRLIKQHLGRGKVELTLSIAQHAQTTHLRVDPAQLQALTEAINQIQTALPEATHINPVDMLKWPGLLQTSDPLQPTLTEDLLEALDLTLVELDQARAREGEALKNTIRQRTQTLRQLAEHLLTQLPQKTEHHLARMQQRAQQLSDSLEPIRLQQEIALLAQKIDVTEELDRLMTHLQEVERLLDYQDVVGRRLDFLMQELNREANTLGSKAFDTELSQTSVEMKVLIEQMREQIQNIE